MIGSRLEGQATAASERLQEKTLPPPEFMYSLFPNRGNLSSRLFRQLLPQRPSQNLPHICLRQIIPEVHVLRRLVSSQRFSAMLDQVLLRDIRILLDDEQRDN